PPSRPTLGWPASAPRAGHAGLQFSGVPALDARRPGGLFPPPGNARLSRPSTARYSCGSSKMWCCGSSLPTRSPISAPGESNEVVLGACPRINTHLSVGVGLSAWRSPLVLFCRLGYHLNTARGDVPDAIPTTQGLMERHVGGSDDLKPSARHVHSATA